MVITATQARPWIFQSGVPLAVRRTVVAILSILLFLGVTQLTSGATAAPSPTDTGPETVAEEAAAPRMFLGRVLRNGSPVRRAEFTVQAWPSTAALSRLPKGAKADLLDIGRVQTDSQGRFFLDFDGRDLPAKYRRTNGYVDLRLVAHDGRWQVPWAITSVFRVTKGVPSWATPQGMAVGQNDPADLTFEIGDLPSVTEKHAPGLAFLPKGSSQPTAAARFPVTEGTPCIPQAGIITYGLSELFMAAWAWTGAYATVTQSTGVEHTLGIGIVDSAGVWSANGTASLSATSTASATRGQLLDTYVFNQMNYQDWFYTSCAYTERRPHSSYGFLTDFAYAFHPYWTACSYYQLGTYTRSSGSNATYGTGVALGPINVSAQSGYNSASSISWTVTLPTALCGSGPEGWVTSLQVEAHAS